MKKRIDIHQQVTDKIIAELEKGAAPWVRPWAVSGTHMPKNVTSDRKYSGVNVLLLWIAADERGFGQQKWLTFKQANEAGGHVRKGETGTHIVFSSRIEKTATNDKGEDVDASFFLLKGYTVFNVAQCENLPEKWTKTPQKRDFDTSGDTDIAAFVSGTHARVEHGFDEACFIPALDTIRMPDRGQFKSCPHYWATLFHEMTHWTGAEKRLGRKLSTRFGDDAYAVEELVAELGSAFISAEFGVASPEVRHAGYINHWLKVLRQDKKAIFKAASLATAAAEYLHSLQPAAESKAA